jgi:hypothetical protein
MPKVDIDYSNTLFYKISCKDTSISDVYIGHTTNFVQRKSGHKQSCNSSKSANHDCKLYKFIRDNGGWDNWRMDIIAYHECNDHYEARKKEQEFFILHKATLNSIEPMPRPKPPRERVNDLNSVKSMHTCEVCKFSCFNTLDVFTQHLTRNKHIKSAIRENTGKDYTYKQYSCDTCDYITPNKSDYQKHLLTAKHISGDTKCTQIIVFKSQDGCKPHYACSSCEKTYKTRSGFAYHKTRCMQAHFDESDGIAPKMDTSLVIELLKQNQEFKDIMLEQSRQIAEIILNHSISV